MARADVPRCQRPEEGPQRAVARCGPFLFVRFWIDRGRPSDVVTPLSVVLRNGAQIGGLISDKREADSRRRFVKATRTSQATT
jgi:hypothetical protein